MSNEPKRTGARRVSEVPFDVLAALNRGDTETVNLVEALAIDQFALAAACLPTLGLGEAVDRARASVDPKQPTAPQRIRLIGEAIAAAGPAKSKLGRLSRHPSDTVRAWAAVAAVGLAGPNLEAKLAAVRPFAADRHFGVREFAWMAVRDAVAEQPLDSIELLVPWTAERDENLRRFASEVTRPRGVWARHITALKADPSPGLAILEPLRADPSKYVRDSVGNWLNDAAKTVPAWVRNVCDRWDRESPVAETAAILRRARRSLV